MKMLKDEVVSFELAKQLKEEDYPQGKSCFKYDGEGNLTCCNLSSEYFDAPTVNEVLKELPNRIFYNFETLAYGLVMSVSRDN